VPFQLEVFVIGSGTIRLEERYLPNTCYIWEALRGLVDHLCYGLIALRFSHHDIGMGYALNLTPCTNKSPSVRCLLAIGPPIKDQSRSAMDEES
jgi:hypothetical protein